MENQLVDLKIRIQELEKENTALKSKMSLMYSNWSYDFNRFTELKEKCKFGYCKEQSDNTVDDSERRDINIDKLRMV
jgi:hypothetical protein